MQTFERVRGDIETRFQEACAGREPPALRFGWSTWGFGREPLEAGLDRLARSGVRYVELAGDRHGPDLGTRDTRRLRAALTARDIQVSGVCGLFSDDNDLSSPRPSARQRALEYVRRNLELAREVGAEYLLVVPGAVGRPTPADAYEWDRSVESLRLVGDEFVAAGVKGAVEPIRSAEVSFCHTLADAARYIAAVDHPGVRHINADIYHMLAGEPNPYAALLEHGGRIVNLHLADTHRGALGEGCLDVDQILMALHCSGFAGRGYCTAEPLGLGANPYAALFGRPNPATLDRLVATTAETFRARERAVREALGEG